MIFYPDFIGRVLELEALDAALERARTGGAPTVLVGGEAAAGPEERQRVHRALAEATDAAESANRDWSTSSLDEHGVTRSW